MDVFEAVRTLLAVRRFRPEAIPDDVVHRIVEAGRLTASAANKQPWHFVVVQDTDLLKALGRVLPSGPYTAEADFAIVMAYERTSPFGKSDTSRAIQNMMLTAWDAGVGSNWVGFPGGLGQVEGLLKIPETLEVLAVVPFGYPAERLGTGRKKRKSLGEVASWNVYGRPFS